MYWNRSANDIAAAWQAEIERKLETGSSALLLGGAPDTLLTSATTLLGLQSSTLQRTDIATPSLLAGGNSALWLGLLLSPQPTGSGPHAPTPTVIYGGADTATYLALVGLTATQDAQPLGMGAQLAPRLQPGVATSWESLPLLEAGEQPPFGMDVGLDAIAAQATVNTGMNPVNDPTNDWIVWGIMLLAFCLVLSALLI